MDTVLVRMSRVALIGACVFCMAQPLRAQEADRLPAPGPIAETAAEIVRERWPIDRVSFTTDEERRPMFRAGVTATLLPPPWHLDPDDASPVPARGAISHREMLAVMTPQEFRPAVVAIPGAGVDPGAIWRGITSAWRGWQERRIHERVERELAALHAASGAQDDEPPTADEGGP